MRIGFGAIGKGYAANRARAVMQDMGISNGWSMPPATSSAGANRKTASWGIAIADPDDKMKNHRLAAHRRGVKSSPGDYEKFLMSDGRRYAHIIDPRTGYPTTGIKSVTIVCPDAELADALPPLSSCSKKRAPGADQPAERYRMPDHYRRE